MSDKKHTQQHALFYLFPSAARGHSPDQLIQQQHRVRAVVVGSNPQLDRLFSSSNVKYMEWMEWVPSFTADKTRPDGCRPPTSTAAG